MEALGTGDSYLLEGILPEVDANKTFYKLREEIQWQEMMHRGGLVPRLVALQGLVEKDGSIPLYRHPVDEHPSLEPYSPTVALLKEHLQSRLNQSFNHVLIQLYRDGSDYISEHADKTLDILIGSNIVNLSFGASRTMALKSKKYITSKSCSPTQDIATPTVNSLPTSPQLERITQKIPLRHNSAFVLGWETNRYFLHSIKQDKRLITEKSPDEYAFNGERISLTFRTIATFRRINGSLYGQGAKIKSAQLCNAATEADVNNHNSDSVASEVTLNSSKLEENEKKLLYEAFSAENHNAGFDWAQYYALGFEVS